MTTLRNETYEQRAKIYLKRTGLDKSDVRLTHLKGDASSRHYMRLTFPDESSRILLLHETAINSDNLPFLNVSELLIQMSIRIPTVHDKVEDLGILVLDDLGDTTLFEFTKTASLDECREAYTEAIKIIVRLQQQGKQLASNSYLPFSQALDEEKLNWELKFFLDYFLIMYSRVNISATARKALEDDFRKLSKLLAHETQVLCHRDYHSRNLMHHQGNLFVIDFQDALMGPDTYDLVSLLKDCYLEHNDSFIQEMLDYYHHQMGITMRSNFYASFELMSLQRHLKALGTFGYQAAKLGNQSYVTDIPRTTRYIEKACKQLPQFARLRDMLNTYTSHVSRG